MMCHVKISKRADRDFDGRGGAGARGRARTGIISKERAQKF